MCWTPDRARTAQQCNPIPCCCGHLLFTMQGQEGLQLSQLQVRGQDWRGGAHFHLILVLAGASQNCSLLMAPVNSGAQHLPQLMPRRAAGTGRSNWLSLNYQSPKYCTVVVNSRGSKKSEVSLPCSARKESETSVHTCSTHHTHSHTQK
jgi:hypothetical protein